MVVCGLKVSISCTASYGPRVVLRSLPPASTSPCAVMPAGLPNNFAWHPLAALTRLRIFIQPCHHSLSATDWERGGMLVKNVDNSKAKDIVD